jgi:hypothetical protein
MNLRYIALVSKVVPKYGLLVEYDMDGNVIKSWHDPTGRVVESASIAVVHDDKVYMGSYHSSFIAVVDY